MHGPPRGNWQKGQTGYDAWDKYVLMRNRANPENTDAWLASLFELIEPLKKINFLEPPG